MVSSINKKLRYLCVILLWFSVTKCQDTHYEDTTLFQQAEILYYQGDYDGALELYRMYLDTHQRTSLTHITTQRIASAEREIKVLYEQRFAPAPIYVNPYRDLSDPQHEVENEE